MVLVSNRIFQVIKFSSLVSFLLYVGTQLRVQATNHHHQPDDETPYYPHSIALTVFFVVHAIAQMYWLRALFSSQQETHYDPPLLSVTEKDIDYNPPPNEINIEPTQLAYIPFYIIGNIILVCANEYRILGNIVCSHVLTMCDTALQIYVVLVLLRNSGRFGISRINVFTHGVAKLSVGLGMLYVWKGWGTIDNVMTPSTWEIAQSSVICLLLTVASGPDPTLGLCIIYDLFALVSGPGSSQLWRHAFIYNIAVIAVVVFIDLLLTLIRGLRRARDDASKPSRFHIILGVGEKDRYYVQPPRNVLV